MAGWISSKLKVAENLLQQIDQQAAQSLAKGETKQSDGLDLDASPKPSGSVSLRDQLKKKTPENSEALGKLSSDYVNYQSLRKLSSDDSSINQAKRGKEAEKLDLTPKPVLNDADWTELLSTPKQSTSTKSNRVNGVSALRGVRKGGGRVGNVGLNVKGNGRTVGTVSKVGDGKDGKADGIGGVRTEGEQSRNSYSSPRVSGVGSDDKSLEGWESILDIGKEVSKEGKKEVEHERNAMGNANESSDTEKLVDRADSVSLAKQSFVSGSNGAAVHQVQDISKEAVHVDQKIRRTPSTADKIAGAISGHLNRAYSGSDDESDSDSGSSSSSDSEIERERQERIQRRKQVLAAKAAAKAAEAIKEQENLVARLEGEKQSLEKIFEERAKQAAQEASELQSTMMEMMEAAELEKQKHNHTRMEILARLAKLETSNADLAKSLATAQWNLEVEVNRVAELRQQVELKEAFQGELKRGISSTNQRGTSLINLVSSKGIELEKEMLEAEYSFVVDKIARLQEKATKLEENIESTQKEMETSTEVEIELKKRLSQMTDHLIQKQSQVEALSSDKAMLLFRIEAVSRLLDENKSLINASDISCSSKEDLEAGLWEYSSSKLRPMFEDKIQSGKQHLGSLLRQLDSIFSAGAVFLARNPAAKLWSLVYLVCLHLWVLYILFSHSRSTEEVTSRSVISLENINNTHGV
ncbi:hypothetical protein Cgig2_010172 [Carnegiea gigantea]|uniref:Golgin candidate 2 n=1 Tax=Carnegiea gigantea TaxID=171969 RepID=A0A9Q1QIC0_9CARY|nr:hypothetical protein Cgig2_010172 [Carnegiea gigantea]